MGKKAPARPASITKERRGEKSSSASWLVIVGVGLAAWMYMHRARIAWQFGLGVEHAGKGGASADEELDAGDDNFAMARDRLFNRGAKSADERNFSDAGYWDDRYRKANDGGRYDWYGVWDGPSQVTIKPHVQAFMPAASASILNIGCGTSRFPEELYDAGYSNLVNVDISQVAVDRMAQELGTLKGLSFLQMDATTMSFEDGSFAAVFEKGTMDALYTNSADLVAKAAAEVFRVLRPGGLFVSVTFGNPSSRTELNATPSPWGSFRTVALEKETGRKIEKGHEADAIYIHIMVKAEVSHTGA